jgi:hypothetical protein
VNDDEFALLTGAVFELLLPFGWRELCKVGVNFLDSGGLGLRKPRWQQGEKCQSQDYRDFHVTHLFTAADFMPARQLIVTDSLRHPAGKDCGLKEACDIQSSG